jgi:hypothetical protein
MASVRLPWRSRYDDVISRQLALFAEENAARLAQIGEARRAYDRAGTLDAEERWGEYMDLVEETEDDLLALRDRYSATMAEDQRGTYERHFWRQAQKLLPSLGARRDYQRQMEPEEEQ